MAWEGGEVGEPRDFREESRTWPTCGNQKLVDMRLNGWGLELFVESIWDTLAKLVNEEIIDPREIKPLILEYRGMTISFDPTIGLEAGGILTPTPEPTP